jgi:hypothetical protein
MGEPFQVTLKVSGVNYDSDDRRDSELFLDSWSWNLDGDYEAEFTESGPGIISPSFAGGQNVSLVINSFTAVSGQITGVYPKHSSDEDWLFGYTIRGNKYKANQVYITAIDGSGTIVYNLPPTDEDYLPSFSGKSVGDIITAVLNQHQTPLSSLGITIDTVTLSQLSSLTLVPHDPVTIQDRLFQSIDTILQRYARNVVSYIPGDGKIRFLDTTTGNTLILVEGYDPIAPVRFQLDFNDCNTNVLVRGKGKIYPAYVSLSKLTLSPTWTATQQSLWNYTDYSQGGDAYSAGVIDAGDIIDATTIRIHPPGGQSWGVNYWNGRQAWIYVHSSAGTGITYTESRPVTANTALSSGGKSDITLGFALENAGNSAYSTYELIGSYAPLGSTLAVGGRDRNNVYRLFNITDPGGLIAQHLVKQFPVQVPFTSYSGTSTQLTNFPEAVVVKGGASWPITFKIMPATGQVLFDEPVVKPLNSMAALITGGSSLILPDDIYMLLAYSRGALSVSYPPNSGGVTTYAGPAYDRYQFKRNKIIDIDSWVYDGNTANMQQYAQMMWASMNDAVRSANIVYNGALTPTWNPGVLVSVSGDGYVTGEEAGMVPVRSMRMDFIKDGSGGLLYKTTVSCNSRRNPRTGDRQYVHPVQFGQVNFKMDLGQGMDIKAGIINFLRNELLNSGNPMAVTGEHNRALGLGVGGLGIDINQIMDDEDFEDMNF